MCELLFVFRCGLDISWRWVDSRVSTCLHLLGWVQRPPATLTAGEAGCRKQKKTKKFVQTKGQLLLLLLAISEMLAKIAHINTIMCLFQSDCII